MQAQAQLKWSDLQKDEKENILRNNDEQPKLAYLEDNVKKVNRIRFTQGPNKLQKFMIGLCDKRIRQERGMIFQDKSFVGHGTYLLYSVDSYNSCKTIINEKSNYNEGGFVLHPNEEEEVSFDLEQRILKIVDVKKPERKVEFKTEHHNLDDLHLCVVILEGELTFQI
ncbi:unnamed protein product (macronuclear) [Paramecium tetraurelia]|uniref:Uncharacterized protein n=1 Tax=Paramecium tetraurelia TaxID=5888 RepID=A0CHZ7_PARTE|nr:uncharacterized protein GSPATT00038516001 [Paramecium tetraurelia]CAK70414.1 unnamed protein product [Paramecium tetraurelia]|eukprot:XP_001437811.1 hypothetical protein (macronuclear) [Paramecium tetraurelia strain d4-2]